MTRQPGKLYGFYERASVEKKIAQDLALCRDWRDAAIRDGWAMKPTIRTTDTTMECELSKEGFRVFVFTVGGIAGSVDYHKPGIHGWGPDGLTLLVAHPYNWETLKSAHITCRHCGAKGPQFMVELSTPNNRACKKCLFRMMDETPEKVWVRGRDDDGQ